MLALSLTILFFVGLTVVVLGWAIWEGPCVFLGCCMVLLDVAARAALERSPLYVDATFSQPALRVQGVLVGALVLGLVIPVLAGRLWLGPPLRLARLDWLVLALVPLVAMSALVGALAGHKIVFVAGDTYKGLVVPASYFVVRLTAARSEDYSKLLSAVAAVSLAVTALAAVEIARRVIIGESLSGVGAPPLLALSVVLAALVVWDGVPRRRMAAASAVAGTLLALNLLSLTRGLWVATALMLAVAIAMSPARMVLRLGGPVAAIFLAGVLLTHSGSGVGDQFEQRLRDLNGTAPTLVTLDPPADPVTSIDERAWEARDATAELRRHGFVAALFGLGAGAEYPTALERIEDTSDEGFRHQIHVTWVSVLFRQGSVGLCVFGAVLACAALLLTRRRKARRPGRDASQVGRVTLALWLPASVLLLTNAYGFFGEVTWGVVLAIVLGLATEDAEPETAEA